MMYRIVRLILHKFNYELVHFAEMERMKRIINGRTKCVKFPDKEVLNEVHIVMRSEEHADYVEVVFAKREDAEEYLKQFGENDYCRYIETMEVLYEQI